MLEIGVGLGTDFVRFARAGAKVTCIDLTEHGVGLVRRRLELEGLEGDVGPRASLTGAWLGWFSVIRGRKAR